MTEGYCLTGDQYLLETKLVVKYRVSDPVRTRLQLDASGWISPRAAAVLHNAGEISVLANSARLLRS